MTRRIFVAALVAAGLLGAGAGVASAAQIEGSVAVTAGRPMANRSATAASPCPSGVRLDAPASIQEQAMLCLTDLARANAGLSPLEPVPDLATSAEEKADDVIACDDFSHYACDREFTYWIREVGYLSAECWRVGENLAWGTGEYGTVSAIFRAWMHSPEHRKNILGDYRQIGLHLEVGNLDGRRDAHVWAQHFGTHCDTPAQP
ncbi:MAG TPA: CAP domain-containing protein [Solirubrobacterales bacterium]|jgi:uncharacterized protein YkwD|nr:CAP domain-containing protein [Solirubrobacterales bacterium]